MQLLELSHPPQRKDLSQRTLSIGSMVLGCAVTPDGRAVAVATSRGISLWDLDTGQRISTLDTEGRGASWLMFRRVGATLVAQFLDEGVRCFDLENGTQQILADADGLMSRACGGGSLASGDHLFFGGLGALYMLQLPAGKERWFQGESERRILCATLSHDGRAVIGGDSDGVITLWDRQGRVQRSWSTHEESISTCTLTPNGRHLISGSSDYTIKVWDVESERCLGTWSGHTWQVSCLDVTPDGRKVVSGAIDGHIKVWDLAALLAGTLPPPVETGHVMLVTRCAILPGRRAISASYDCTARLWALDSGRELGVLAGHRSVVADCATSTDGRLLATASWDRTVRLWDGETLAERAVLTGHECPVLTCALTSSNRLISGDAGGVMIVWDLETGRPLTRVLAHFWPDDERPRARARVSRCAVTADGRRAISVGYDGRLALWELHSGRELWRVDTERRQLSDCAIAADDETAAVGCLHGEVQLWSLRKGALLRRFTGHEATAAACAFSDDGRQLISGSYDETLRLWSMDSGELLETVPCRGPVRAVATRGRDVVAGDAAGNVWMWRLLC